MVSQSVRVITATSDLEALLGEQIRSMRLRLNTSQADLAQAASVAVGSLRSLESGNGATVGTLVSVLRALGRTDWIESLQPEVSISPMQMIRSKHTRQRARRTDNSSN